MKKKTCTLVYSRIYYVIIFVDSDVFGEYEVEDGMVRRDKGSCAQEHALSPLAFTTVVEHRQVNVCYLCT